MLIAKRFISSLVRIHRKHPVSTKGGTWYPMTCRFLGLVRHIDSSYEKNMIERRYNSWSIGQKVSTISFYEELRIAN